jgi:hypothetical protein
LPAPPLDRRAADAKAEVFAQSSQLLAKTKTVEPLVWADLKP